MSKSPYKMKGSPMQRNFGVGEKESPAKVVITTAALIGAGITAAIGAGTSAKLAADKKADAKRDAASAKREASLNEASDAIVSSETESDRLV